MPRALPPDAEEWQPWARVERLTALAYAGLILVACLLAGWIFRQDVPLAISMSASPVAAAVVYWAWTGRIRHRHRLLRAVFPPEWEGVLRRDVAFFRALDSEAQRERFRHHVRLFLGEKQVTGIGVEVDATTLVLAAASAVIPIFGFPGWEWHQINEVLIYPDRFKRDYSVGESDDHRILGMVGTGAMNRLMILSKPDLIAGFRTPGDKRNVGVHEFAHLVDLSDGALDGNPVAGLDRGAIGPWVDLVRRKMQEIDQGRSDIDPYALTNEAEFFAVSAEYFFERPGVMQQKHPALYAAMERVFNQNLGARLASIRREVSRSGRGVGRNAPCPCGSGRKFKHCCLGTPRAAG